MNVCVCVCVCVCVSIKNPDCSFQLQGHGEHVCFQDKWHAGGGGGGGGGGEVGAKLFETFSELQE